MARNKKFVLILTADAGFGHRSAANALAAAFRETHRNESTCQIVNVLDDPQTPRGLRESQADYDHLARNMPDLYKIGYKATDANAPKTIIERGMQAMLYGVMRRILMEKRPDLIVSTYPLYPAPLGAVFTLTKKFVPLVSVVTDLETVHQIWFNAYPDLIIVPTRAVRTLALAAKVPSRKIAVIGIPVHPDYSEEKRSKPEIREALGWERRLTTILITGSRRSRLYLEAADILNHSGLPIQLIVVAGGDDEGYARLRAMTWHRPAHVYYFVKNMPTMMRAVDGIVCKAGGLTVTESLACGLPMLLMDVIPGQETGNADWVSGGGAGKIITDPRDVLETVCHWLENDGAQLKHWSANARRLGRPRAAFEIVERIWPLAARGPVTREPSQVLAVPRMIEFFSRYGVLEEGLHNGGRTASRAGGRNKAMSSPRKRSGRNPKKR